MLRGGDAPRRLSPSLPLRIQPQTAYGIQGRAWVRLAVPLVALLRVWRVLGGVPATPGSAVRLLEIGLRNLLVRPIDSYARL